MFSKNHVFFLDISGNHCFLRHLISLDQTPRSLLEGNYFLPQCLYRCPLVSSHNEGSISFLPGLITLPRTASQPLIWFLLKPRLQGLPEPGAPSGLELGCRCSGHHTGLGRLLSAPTSFCDAELSGPRTSPFSFSLSWCKCPFISSKSSFVISLLLFFPPR